MKTTSAAVTTAAAPCHPILAISNALIAVDSARQGWGQPPVLGILVTAPELGVFLAPVYVPPAMWDAYEPTATVRLMSDNLAATTTIPQGSTVVGAALLAEAWVLELHGVPEDAAHKALDWSEQPGNRIADHPFAAQAHMVLAIDTTGARFARYRLRFDRRTRDLPHEQRPGGLVEGLAGFLRSALAFEAGLR